MHKNQWNSKSCNEKKLKLIPGLMCFKNVQPISGQPNETLLVLKDLQPSRADKASRPCLGISFKKIELG